MSAEFAHSTLVELAQGLLARRYSAVELTRHYLDRIAKADGKLHAYVSVDEEGALALAAASDARRAAGYVLGLLDGLPIALKDLYEIEGRITTAGSQAWAERRSDLTGTAVRRLIEAGMVVLGKTHMVEFAFGGWGTNPVMGTPHNPWDLATHRVPGGSSSGSAVAVAAGLAPAALGSDTGGSVRIPAALNGITGLKTTFGLISLHGTVPLSHTLDSIGPMTRDARDAMLLTQVLVGSAASAMPLLDYSPVAEGVSPLAGVCIRVLPPAQYPVAPSDEMLEAFDAACQVLLGLGATIDEVVAPFDFHTMMVQNGQLIAAESYALHRDYIEDPSLPLGRHVRARVLGGQAVSAADYLRALEEHARAKHVWCAWMRGADALMTPGVPFPACPLDEVDEAQTPMASFTRAGNFMGACGLVLPAGLSSDGLPLAVQLLGKPYDDTSLCRIGMAFQRVSAWHRKVPDLSSLGL
ncbi:MAG: amidase [Bordetella sp.]|uniref:amidase n=1 Tax=Bordetella sp. TaxID=28081 RepID=UPI003F7BC544